MKTFQVKVVETYETIFSIEADDEDEAIEKAEMEAADDFNITSPENMTDREVSIV